MIYILFIAMTVLILAGIPISIAMILSVAAALFFSGTYTFDIIVQGLYYQCESFPLLAIPLFIFAGGIMAKGGMSDRLIRLASALVGNVRGGMGIISILACMFFAAVSGSTAATTAAIGSVMIPAIIKSGFSPGSATSLQATAGSIGIIIPPSIPFVLMGVISGVSIGKLFLGGIIPGITTGLGLMLTCYIISRVQKHAPSGRKFSLAEVGKAFRQAILPLFTVIVIVGAIMSGTVTVTEAAILAVVWALSVSVLIYRSMGWKDLSAIMCDTVAITGVVVFCIGATSPFAWLMTAEQVPQELAEAMLSLTSSPFALKLLMLAVFLVIGTFLDLTPAMIILVPIFLPIAHQSGMDPVQFGVVTVMALGIGQCTPPVGIALFVACSISNIKIGNVMLPLIPFLLAMVLVLLLAAFWTSFSTFLPALLLNAK